MKRLILLLLLPILACSETTRDTTHEHPLIAHEHSLINHTHDPVAYPAANLIWKEPQEFVSDKQPIGIGELTYDGQQQVWVIFSEPPIGLTVTDVPDPDNRPTIPINAWFLERCTLKIVSYCTEETAAAGRRRLCGTTAMAFRRRVVTLRMRRFVGVAPSVLNRLKGENT